MSELPKSILTGVNEIINKQLFIGNQFKEFRYKQKRSCNQLSKNPPNEFDGVALIEAIYATIENNLNKRPDRKVSSKNWKVRSSDDNKSIKTSKHNTSDEVTLERAIVEKWPTKWTYQMPVASGIFGSNSDKRRAIDLVHSNKNGDFEFVELKMTSDTPLYAAMEILGYGLVYLASRRDSAKNLKYNDKTLPVLKAEKISLCLLAPEEYYEKCNLKWLQIAINEGLKNITKDDFDISFRFEKFEPKFKWNHKMSYIDLPELLVRNSVY